MAGSGKASTLFKLTASSLIITTLLAGCKPAALAERPHSAGSGMDITARLASKVAAQAAQALAVGNYDQAAALAEGAVSAAPNDAGYRTLLGQAYLRAGRFVSADQAFADVIRLMPDNDKARVAQAVAKIAWGDRTGAKALLSQVTNAPADDYGLALALVGEAQQAVAVLEPAARGMRGTSRTRQNLALAYALAGQWEKARAVAAQDVSAADIDRRMENWARLASPDARDMQVATLLGTKAVAGDPGQPVMLALAQPAAQPAPVAVAAAEAVVETSIKMIPAASQPVAQAPAVAEKSLPTALATQPTMHAPAPAEIRAVAIAASVVASAPAVSAPVVIAAPAVPVHPSQRLAVAEHAPADVRKAAVEVAVAAASTPTPATVKSATAEAAAAPVAAPLTQAQPVASAEPVITVASMSNMTRVAFEPRPLRKPVQAKGQWVVQLGSYRNKKRVEAGWVHLSDNFQRLAQYSPAQSIYTIVATGAVYHRLSVTGFATRESASQLCRVIKNDGGSCFVRLRSDEAPIRMVSRDQKRLAALY